MENLAIAEKRPRGRPQVRSDEDTKSVIIEAANERFMKDGYASASISQIAQNAGVSTKTLYRLFPTKSDLFSEVISEKIGRYFLSVSGDTLSGLPLREGLERLLIAYGRLTLSPETIIFTRLVLGESERFPELSSVFYEQAVKRTSQTMERWLKAQAEFTKVRPEDIPKAIGMLRGMMTMEPQRSVMLGRIAKVTDEDIVSRARLCTTLFLDGFAASFA